jgi:hypothetical protein
MGLPMLSQAVQQMLLIVRQLGWRMGDGSGHGVSSSGHSGEGRLQLSTNTGASVKLGRNKADK